MALSPVMIELRASIDQFSAKMAEARAEVAKLETQSATHLAKFQAFGKAAALGVAAGVTVIGVESIKMAGEFQQATAVLQTAAGESSRGLTVVREGIKSIAKETGTTWQNLAEGMYTVEKAGYRGAEGLKVLRAAAQGAREENASLADVTNAMTSVMASYHLGADKSVQVMNALKTAAGEGKMTMESMSAAMSTVIPIAAVNKISFGEVAGAMATLTQHGTSSAEATQELAATITRLAAPNKVAVAEMQQLGLNSQDVSQKLGQRGLSGTIALLTQTVAEHTKGGMVSLGLFKQSSSAVADMHLMMTQMSPAAKQMASDLMNNVVSLKDFRKHASALTPEQAAMARQFANLSVKAHGFSDAIKRGDPATQTFSEAIKKMTGGTIGLNTVLQLSGESTDAYHERIKKVSDSFNHASKDVEGWAQTQKLFNVQMDMLSQTVQVAAINIGDKLIPVVTAAAGYLAKHKDVVEALALAIGGVLVAAIGAWVGGLIHAASVSTINFARMIVQGEAFAATQEHGFAKSLAAAIRWVAVTVAQGAVWVATTAAQGAVWLAGVVARAAAASAAMLASFAAQLAAAAAWAAGMLVAGATALLPFLPIIAACAAVGIAAYELYKNWDKVWSGIKTVVSSAWDFIRPIFDTIKSAVGDITGGLGKVAGLAGKVSGAVGGAGHFLGGLVGANAEGTDNWRGGLSLVGERGPELVNLPRGTQVIPNHKLGGGDTYNIEVHVGAALGTKREIADAVQEALLQKKARGGSLGLA